MTTDTPADPKKVLQAEARAILKPHGFRARGWVFNRTSSDGLTQVVQIQFGRFDPPGTVHLPGMRENLCGKFTVNVGIYVPEFADCIGPKPSGSFVGEADCCIRARLGEIGPDRRDIWWDIDPPSAWLSEQRERLERDAIGFLARYSDRDSLLHELSAAEPFTLRPNIIGAVILARRGQSAEARRLLAAQLAGAGRSSQSEHINALANKLGLGQL